MVGYFANRLICLVLLELYAGSIFTVFMRGHKTSVVLRHFPGLVFFFYCVEVNSFFSLFFRCSCSYILFIELNFKPLLHSNCII